MKVEFFHDVICSFCFPMSDRMRSIKKELPGLTISHKSYALGWEPEDFMSMFGSREAVKSEVLTHWVHANENDERHRFNIEGMKQTSFDFPTSKNGLLAAKAAGMLGDQEDYWEVFDKLQEGVFVRSLNIEEPSVIETLIKETSIDFEKWFLQFNNPETEEAVRQDLALAAAYGLQGVPALVVNGKYLISGAQPKDVIIQTLVSLMEKESAPLEEINTNAEACHFDNDKWTCD
jgi:predicted DsbA family dithiol-disulfide isomerase